MGVKLNTDEQELQMIDDYKAGMPVDALIHKYGYKTKKTIIDKIKKHYPYELDEIKRIAHTNRKQYKISFEKIDTEFNAYFIGLMLTDGWIVDKDQFAIQLTDEDCIRFISEVTGNPYKRYDYKEGCLPFYRLVFSGKEEVTNLARFGVIENKSYIIPRPRLREEEKKFIPYIIRGIIDGDGCIYSTTKNTVALNIVTMSSEFALWIKEQLETCLHMKDISLKQQENKLWLVHTSMQTNIFKLIALVYDKPYGMNRKYELLRRTFRDYNSGNPIFMLD